MLFFFTFYPSQNTEVLSSKKTIFIINQHIRMISEGTCDTEDWSNNVENSAFDHRNNLCFKVY